MIGRDKVAGDPAPAAVPPSAEEWSRFIDDLRLARVVQLSAAEIARNGELPDELKRANLRAAEHAFISFLELLHGRPEIMPLGLHEPLVELANALAVVAEGGRPPLLEPIRRKTKRGGASPARLATMVFGAIALDSLMEVMPRLDAAKVVARRISAAKLPVKPRAGASLDATILNWRESLMEGDGTAPAGVLQIWRAYQNNPASYGPTPKARADRILDIMRRRDCFLWD